MCIFCGWEGFDTGEGYISEAESLSCMVYGGNCRTRAVFMCLQGCVRICAPKALHLLLLMSVCGGRISLSAQNVCCVCSGCVGMCGKCIDSMHVWIGPEV